MVPVAAATTNVKDTVIIVAGAPDEGGSVGTGPSVMSGVTVGTGTPLLSDPDMDGAIDGISDGISEASSSSSSSSPGGGTTSPGIQPQTSEIKLGTNWHNDTSKTPACPASSSCPHVKENPGKGSCASASGRPTTIPSPQTVHVPNLGPHDRSAENVATLMSAMHSNPSQHSPANAVHSTPSSKHCSSAVVVDDDRCKTEKARQENKKLKILVDDSIFKSSRFVRFVLVVWRAVGRMVVTVLLRYVVLERWSICFPMMVGR